MNSMDLQLTKGKDGLFDISFSETGDFSLAPGFETALEMSIFCERRASPVEVPEAIRRRGWIGNVLSDFVGFEIGSKLWLFEQSRLTNLVLNGVKDAVSESVDWLIDDELVKNITTSIAKVNSTGTITLLLTIEFSSSQVEQRFFDLWEKTGT